MPLFLPLISMATQAQHFHWHFYEHDNKDFQFHGRTLLFIIFFTLFLLFTLLCLYARWLYRYHRRSATATAAAASASTSHQTTPPIRSVGLDPATVDSLPIILHHSSISSADETQCSICITTFKEQENVKVLPRCSHAFHPECVDKWLSTQSSCPLCRASLLADSTPE
ncbi:hypothetical protein NE237_003200 [Protea cynaroides]|uniref:RING-type E3 ubiquitin transferase n=1 Tax=Protea cynaroides TaxID=273540 RepID=A0A9Q0KGY7_9MAGN|nr:hypothetical protein NE237_003200 [Protea cynaroides]